MIVALLNWLRKFWVELRRRSAYANVRTIDSMDSLPIRLGRTIYIVSRGGEPRWVVFDCPCGCGARIDVNLMKSKCPSWDLFEEEGAVTLRPSLWQPAGTCMSHFFIERNRVRWV